VISRCLQHLGIVIILLIMSGAGCKNSTPEAVSNVRPTTYLWLYPDSTLAQGPSTQHIRWWGNDVDGYVKGFLFAAGKLIGPSNKLPSPDTIGYRWRTANDTTVQFPLLTRQDTFQVVVRAVDNTFIQSIPQQAMIRMSPTPYWDQNENGKFDSTDVPLPSLAGAVDKGFASLGLPLLNQPPTVVFAPNPNDPTITMQQPETTFTAATFAWVGSDPDGDNTIAAYDIALNDTSDTTRILTLPPNTKLVTLFVPRARSDVFSTVADVDADVYSGTYATSRRLLGTLSHLRLDTLNTFYVRARDIAGDMSKFKALPDPAALPARHWFVRNPHGKLLIVNDFIDNVSGTKAAVQNFYTTIFQTEIAPDFPEFANFDVLDISSGLTAADKQVNKPGALVPPFIDPALISTLHLFDVVFWYTDPYPSMGVAQFPLFEYVRDASHTGKVIYSTMFATSNDPRGALTDFAPLDSVSSVDLSSVTNPQLPRPGDTRVLQSSFVYSDSSNLSELFPNLQFNVDPTPTRSYSLFMRPIYKRSDSRYIYHMQADTRIPLRYAYTSTLLDLNAAAAKGGNAWACGENGVILASTDNGQTWNSQNAGVGSTLEAVQFLSATYGWIAGDNGTILGTEDGGATWSNHSVPTFESLLAIAFPITSQGFAGGTDGIFIRSTNSGTTWAPASYRTNKTIRSIAFGSASNGIAVGDSGLTISTSDGGNTWHLTTAIVAQRLNSVQFLDAQTAVAVGANHVILRSTDAGSSWSVVSSGGAELRGVSFADNLNGWVAGIGGTILHSVDGGLTWGAQNSGVGQDLLAPAASGISTCWMAGTNGVILYTTTGGSGTWVTQPPLNINVGVIDGQRSFVFLGLPLHLLNGSGGTSGVGTVKSFLEYILHQEFGF